MSADSLAKAQELMDEIAGIVRDIPLDRKWRGIGRDIEMTLDALVYPTADAEQHLPLIARHVVGATETVLAALDDYWAALREVSAVVEGPDGYTAKMHLRRWEREGASC
jgi:hypothetical protein